MISDEKKKSKILIIKRIDIIFNDVECEVVNFIDITTYEQLKEQKTQSKLLKKLLATVHHELMNPLNCNVYLT